MTSPSETENRQLNRKHASIAVVPLIAVGLLEIILMLEWGLNPLLGFVILPPILFIVALAWIFSAHE